MSSALNKLTNFIRNPLIRFGYLSKIGLFNEMPDEKYISRMFFLTFGYKLDLANPQTFNEKIQWLKLFNRKPEYTMMVDKYQVKNYVATMIGKEYIIPTIGVWDHAEDIDFSRLPNQFVLKCNHNSGRGMCICKDKSKLNEVQVKKGLNGGLKENYYLHAREWPYKDVPRKIIAEKYMEDPSSPNVLNDYKILCFNGEPKLIELHEGRFTNHHTQDFYDTTWKKTKFVQPEDPLSDGIATKPKNLDKMIEYSKLLAKDIPHVRVDWYEISGKLYFGELTFFDGGGFSPFSSREQDLEIGSWLTLPDKEM